MRIEILHLTETQSVAAIPIKQSDLKDKDWFVWKNEVHQFHSDAGYGIKTYTEYNEEDGSSLIVNWSNLMTNVLASSWEIDPSIPLLPEWVWKKKNELPNSFEIEKFSMLNNSDRKSIEAFASGAIWMKSKGEAAGGYTKQDMLDFAWQCKLKDHDISITDELDKFKPNAKRPTALEVETEATCPDCGGDGIETCHNPDHGFLRVVGDVLLNANESACPVCGHDPYHKVRKRKCETCQGIGVTSVKTAMSYADESGYDDEIIERIKTIPHPTKPGWKEVVVKQVIY